MNKYLLFILSVHISLLPMLTGCEDSLDKATYTTETHLDSVNVILKIIDSIMVEDPTQALDLATQGLKMVPNDGQLSPLKGELLALMGDIFRLEARYQDAIGYYEQAEMIAIGLGDSAAYSNRLGSKGYAYFQAGDDVKALKYLSKSIVLLKRNKDAIQTNATTQSKEEIYQSSLLNLYIDLLQLYSSRGEVDKAEAYIDSSQLLINQTPHRALEARFLAAVGRLRLNEGRAQSSYATAIDLIEESIQNFRESNKIYLSLGDPELAAENNPNIATAFQIWAGLLYQDPSPAQPDAYLSKLDSSFLYITEYLQISQSQNRMKGVSFGLRRLASYNVNMGKYELAKSQILQSLQAAGEIGASRDSAYAYWQLGELYETMGEYKAAIECYQEYDRLAATFRNQTSAKAMAFAEAKYKTDIISLEKEQIRTLAKQRFRNTLTIAGTGAVILLVFIGYFYMRNQQQRKLMSQQSKMNRQLVVDLIKEQAIESLNSKLEGQEKERKRIARELHDRLGGTLAAAKLSLEGLGRRLGSNHKEHYSHAQDLLQLAYQETRQLSHDMMALPLKHLGLEASFQALCDTINKSGKIEVNYDATFQTASFLSPEAEIHLYRILQELLQNVIKHARATQVFVQITQTLDSFTLLVEDNGRGFPKNASKQSRGMGLSNIQDRIHHLKGTLEIDSQPGKGSTIIIQLPPTV